MRKGGAKKGKKKTFRLQLEQVAGLIQDIQTTNLSCRSRIIELFSY